MRGFEEDQRAGNAGKFLQPLRAGLLLLRQEAGKEEGVRREARGKQRGKGRRGTGDRHHWNLGGDCLLHDPVAGVRHQRRSGVRDQRHRQAGLEIGKERGAGVFGIVLVIGEHPPLDAEAMQQLGGDARILAGEAVGPGDEFQPAQGHVAEIADRRRHQIEARLRLRRRVRHIPDAIAAGGLVSLCHSHATLSERFGAVFAQIAVEVASRIENPQDHDVIVLDPIGEEKGAVDRKGPDTSRKIVSSSATVRKSRKPLDRIFDAFDEMPRT